MIEKQKNTKRKMTELIKSPRTKKQKTTMASSPKEEKNDYTVLPLHIAAHIFSFMPCPDHVFIASIIKRPNSINKTLFIRELYGYKQGEKYDLPLFNLDATASDTNEFFDIAKVFQHVPGNFYIDIHKLSGSNTQNIPQQLRGNWIIRLTNEHRLLFDNLLYGIKGIQIHVNRLSLPFKVTRKYENIFAKSLMVNSDTEESDVSSVYNKNSIHDITFQFTIPNCAHALLDTCTRLYKVHFSNVDRNCVCSIIPRLARTALRVLDYDCADLIKSTNVAYLDHYSPSSNKQIQGPMCHHFTLLQLIVLHCKTIRRLIIQTMFIPQTGLYTEKTPWSHVFAHVRHVHLMNTPLQRVHRILFLSIPNLETYQEDNCNSFALNKALLDACNKSNATSICFDHIYSDSIEGVCKQLLCIHKIKRFRLVEPISFRNNYNRHVMERRLFMEMLILQDKREIDSLSVSVEDWECLFSVTLK
jgi:hypothetical protein